VAITARMLLLPTRDMAYIGQCLAQMLWNINTKLCTTLL